MQNKSKTIDEHIGLQLQIMRIMQHITRKDLAAVLDVTTEQIRKYELGRNRMTAKSLYVICSHFNVKMNFFFEGFDKSKLEETKIITENKTEEQPASRLKKFLNIH